jgi:hypothetical protein
MPPISLTDSNTAASSDSLRVHRMADTAGQEGNTNGMGVGFLSL